MRYLLLSDIHANAFAFEAVIRHASKQRWDQVIFLGDIVGYYTQPERVIEMLRELEPSVCILGNHDALLLDLAEERVVRHREDSVVQDILSKHLVTLSPDSLTFLRSFERHVVHDSWEATHGALRSPWEYLSTLQNAQANLELMRSSLCFVGHTHVPKIFASVSLPKGDIWRTVSFRGQGSAYRMPPKARVFFNPGSVGQPRDGVPLASYAIFDDTTRTGEVFRVEYDLLAMQRSIHEHAYPNALASRLAVGK